MEEIKVGEYCRTYEGYIMKCIRIDGDIIEFENYIDQAQVVYDDEKNEIVLLDFEREYEIDVIKSHSSNIIDLIEVGDYVNGYRVVDITIAKYKPSSGVEIDCSGQSEDAYLWVDEIKSIVTKKQFNSMEYHVGGKEE